MVMHTYITYHGDATIALVLEPVMRLTMLVAAYGAVSIVRCTCFVRYY